MSAWTICGSEASLTRPVRAAVFADAPRAACRPALTARGAARPRCRALFALNEDTHFPHQPE